MTAWSRTFDWRRVLIYTHRWLGIGGGLVFLVWFASGVVMMYERMPRLTPEERLARLPILDAARIRVSLADAAATAGVTPDRVRVGMAGARPVYRLDTSGHWTTVFADSGERLDTMTPGDTVRVVQALFPEHASTLAAPERITAPDQWLLDGGLTRFLPMQRVALGDADGTVVYVSERTADIVMKTTARGRAWGYAGAVLHWTYFTPFRVQRELWRYTIIWVALVGSVMCLTGLVIGVWRFSPSKRFRLRRVASHSPYSGWMWWHHYAGLLFGLFTFTWALSGALSLTPWNWAPSTEPTDAQRLAVSGGGLRVGAVTSDALRRAVARVSDAFPVKELEVLQFTGRPFALAYRADSLERAAQSRAREVNAILSPQLAIAHRNIWLDAPEADAFQQLDRDAVLDAARDAMPGASISDARWLDDYDAYYYDRRRTKPLPVLRATYRDADGTSLYLDPNNGLISLRETPRSRANRWLYNGLHSLDFPFLYDRRPAWDIVTMALSLGGVALSATTLIPALRRIRRHLS